MVGKMKSNEWVETKFIMNGLDFSTMAIKFFFFLRKSL